MNHQIIKRTIWLFCLVSPVLFAQDSRAKQTKLSFSIRGKYIVFGVFEDLYWRGYSYGGEFFLGKRHAFGVDGGVFRTRNEEDDSKDRAMYSDIFRRSYLFVDYKYLFFLKSQVNLYVHTYAKLSGRTMGWSVPHEYEYEAPVDLTFLQETSRGKFTDIGIGTGMKYYFNGSKFGLDISLSGYKRFGSYLQTVYSTEDGWSSLNTSDSKYGLYVRISFFYHFFRVQHNRATESK